MVQSSTEGDMGTASRSHALRNTALAFGVALAAAGGCVWVRPLEVFDNLTHARLWLHGMRGRYAMLNGHRIHYYEGGAGSPVVLVHGLGSRALDWASLIPHLLHGGHRVYVLDLLGYGHSARPTDASYSIEQQKSIVEAFLENQGLAQCDLAGWSMGGWVAACVALDHPDRVRRLVLYAAAGLEFTPDFDLDILEPDTPQKWAALRKVLGPGREPARPLPGFVLRDIFRRQREIGWVVRRGVDAMMTRQDVLDGKLSALKMPVLIVWGRQDQMIPLSVGERLHAQIPQSMLEVYDDCGHMAPAGCADRIGPSTVRFLNTQAPPAVSGIATSGW